MSRCVYLIILLTYPIAPQGQSPQTLEWQKKRKDLSNQTRLVDGFHASITHGHAKPTASPKAQKLQHSNFCLINIRWSKLDLHSQHPSSPIPAPQKLVLATAPSSTTTSSSSTLSMGDQRKLSIVLVTSWANLSTYC